MSACGVEHPEGSHSPAGQGSAQCIDFTFYGSFKGKTAIRVFHKFPELKTKRYWDNHFWVEGYCVDTVGLDSEMIRKYVKYQEQNEAK